MRRSAAVSFLCIVLAGGLLLLASWAAAEKPGGKLSSRLNMLARSPHLLSTSAAVQAAGLSLPVSGSGSLIRSSKGHLLVEIRMNDVSAFQQQELINTGVEIVHVSDRYMTITAYVDPANVTPVTGLPAVSGITEVLTPGLNRRYSPLLSGSYAILAPNSTCPSGTAVSEGNTQLQASLARANYGLSGSGVQVGVLSDSYDLYASAATHAAGDVLSGDLPGTGNTCGYVTPVNVLQEYSGAATNVIDEGRAMLQIVHDLAPAATLSFASAFNGLNAFADNIRTLRNTSGADIIVDDVYYYAEPFFQAGPVNVAISNVVAAGASYFTSSGNANYTLNGKYVGSYEAPAYRPVACPAGLPFYVGDCHNFDHGPAINSSSRFTLANNGALEVDFQWNEPWYGVVTDIDIYILDSTNTVVASSEGLNTGASGSQTPFEYIYYQNTTGSPQDYRLVISRYSGTATPRIKYVLPQSTSNITSVQYDTSAGGDIYGPTLTGHSATHDGLSVAAVPFNNSTVPENFSSRGTATHYYGPVSGTTPASPITPDVLEQPDFAATDGGCTTFFYSFSGGCYRFYGTSAAAPHAAAVAALLKQEANALRDDLDQGIVKYLLQSTTRMVSGGDVLSVGSGLIDASAAAAKLSAGDHYPVARYTSGGSFTLTYSSLQAGYDSAASDESLRIRAAYVGGNIDFNSVRNITVSGGYDAGFSTYSGMSTLHGIITISGTGTVTVEYLELI